MLGDHPFEFLMWMLLLPLIVGALLGIVMGLGFVAVAGLTAVNHGLAVLVRRSVETFRSRRSVRAAGQSPRASDPS